jgi:phosphatidylserine decarboxylase
MWLAVVLVAFLILCALLFGIFLFWRLWFCRQPARVIPSDDRLIVSPANGTVAVVRRFDTKTVTAKKWNHGSVEFVSADVARTGWFILIVMTPFNVHYQRAPINGKILSTQRVPGKFLNAVKDAQKLLTLQNERNEILFNGARGKMKVVQIAGFLARRISCFVKAGEKIDKGMAIGFIDLGSQVAVILPEQVKPSVKPGDIVIDGESVLGVYE